MITLDELSVDLLSEIFSLIHDSSRHTIFSLLRVNKAVSGATLPFVYRECTFDFSQNVRNSRKGQASDTTPFISSLEKLASLLELNPKPDAAIWRGVRKVTVHSSSVVWEGEDRRSSRFGAEPPFVPSEELVQAKWRPFVEFLSRIINLCEVVFDCPERVPAILLKALEEKHPSCRLHVKNWTRVRCDVKVGDPYEETLARSPCLRSLEGHFLTGGPRISYNHSAFERILALAPNLEAMSYSTRSAGGCVVYGIDPEQEAEAKRERQKFAVVNPVRKSRMRRIRYNSLHSSVIQSWETFFDPRKLETLDLKTLDNTEWMGYARDNGIFGGLKHLSFRITHYPQYSSQSLEEFKASLADFLDSCYALESLSIVSYHGYIDLPSILDRHGESLRSLGLHQVEGTQNTRPALTRDDLKLIRSKAPSLECLEFDVNRTINPSANESETYRVVSSFPDLRHLTLHYDLGIRHTAFSRFGFSFESDADDGDRFSEIYTDINENFAKDVWRAVRGEELEEMIIYDGEPNREIGFGYPASWVLLEQDQRQRLRVTRNECDDLKDDVSAVKVLRKGRVRFPLRVGDEEF